MNSQALAQIYPTAGARIALYLPLIEATWREFDISTPKRQAAWLAQIGIESMQLRYTKELGGDAYFAKYEGRSDLGNDQPGDGIKYKGRGLIQITGRTNYTAISRDFGIDFIGNPARLEEPEPATRSAGWFWATRKLNEYADTDRFGALTKRINGGYNHLDERIGIWLTARRVLNVA